MPIILLDTNINLNQLIQINQTTPSTNLNQAFPSNVRYFKINFDDILINSGISSSFTDDFVIKYQDNSSLYSFDIYNGIFRKAGYSDKTLTNQTIFKIIDEQDTTKISISWNPPYSPIPTFSNIVVTFYELSPTVTIDTLASDPSYITIDKNKTTNILINDVSLTSETKNYGSYFSNQIFPSRTRYFTINFDDIIIDGISTSSSWLDDFIIKYNNGSILYAFDVQNSTFTEAGTTQTLTNESIFEIVNEQDTTKISIDWNPAPGPFPIYENVTVTFYKTLFIDNVQGIVIVTDDDVKNLTNTIDLTNFKNSNTHVLNWNFYKIEFYYDSDISPIKTINFDTIPNDNLLTLDMTLKQLSDNVECHFKIKRISDETVFHISTNFILHSRNLTSNYFSLTPISVTNYSLLFDQNGKYIYLDNSSVDGRVNLSFNKSLIDVNLINYELILVSNQITSNSSLNQITGDSSLEEYYVFSYYALDYDLESPFEITLKLRLVDKRTSFVGHSVDFQSNVSFVVHKCDFNNFNDFNINPISNINNFHTTKLRFNITNDYISFTYDGTNYKTESLKNTFQPNPFSITPKNNLISYLKLKTNQYLGESLSIIDAIDDAILLERVDNIAGDTHVVFPVKSYKLYNSDKYLVVSSDTVSFTSIDTDTDTDAEKQTASWTELNDFNTWNAGGYMMLYHDITSSSANDQYLYAENNTLKVNVQTSVPTEYPAIEDYLWIFDNGRVFELNNVQESAIISIDNIDNYNIVHGKNYFSFQTKNVLNGISSILPNAASSEQNVSSKYKTLTVNFNLKASVSCKVQ